MVEAVSNPRRDLWSVCDFARRYRLPRNEEDRLRMLFGPVASVSDLLASATRLLPEFAGTTNNQL
jgi:hypothetical protein